ncbi:DUF2125 domain-containing protein [Oryzibacter oryziterrae]|uniref:DUF2125 domain-containing protein n=1 Tax=Oryzibacter oryziterrae TaxID=2766474 RepID=UPI001F33B330|nr:DUF2125 domain-containing protein [Oryzibacter oryziterrae]
MRGKWIALAGAIVVVAGGWTGAWLYARHWLAGQVEPFLTDLERNAGVRLTCPQREISGWPFRMDLTCLHPTVDMPDGTHVEMARLVGTGVIDDWHLLRFAVEAPVRVAAPDGSTAVATFSSLVASLRFEKERLERLSLAGDGLDVEGEVAGAGRFATAMAHAEAHVRGNPDQPEDADLAASFKGLTIGRAPDTLLPAPADGSADLSLTKVMVAGGDLPSWSAAGGQLLVRDVTLSLGETTFKAVGQGGVDADGYPTGSVTLTGHKPEALIALAKTSGKPLNPAVAGLGTAMLLMGKPVNGDRQIDLSIADGGKVSAGAMALGRVAPLF